MIQVQIKKYSIKLCKEIAWLNFTRKYLNLNITKGNNLYIFYTLFLSDTYLILTVSASVDRR